MTGFVRSIGATMIAAAALMLFAAPVAKAERIVPATAAQEFQVAQEKGGQGDMMGQGQKGGGMGQGQKGGGKSCGMMGGGKYRSHFMMGPEMMAARLEGKLAFLKTSLKIRNDQEATFEAFADALRPRVKPTKEMRTSLMKRKHSKDKPGALERLELREKKITVRHENLMVVRKALGQLFGALDEDQKKLVDKLFAHHRFRNLL